MAITAGVLEILIKTKDETSSGLSAAENKVKSFTGSMSSWAVAKGQLISNFVQKTGKAVINLGKDAVQTGMSFDKAMSQYIATRGATIDDLRDETSAYYKEMQQMTKFAREMGLEGKYNATEVAQALNYMALAGYSATTSMEMMPQVLALAAAGDMDLARASDIVTDAQTAFGLKIDETKTMVDQMAKTASITNTSVEQLGEAFLTVGANARSIIHNGDTSELSALLGQLASNGIKGAKGGTVLRNILNALANPAGKAAKQLKDLGVSAYDSATHELKPMTDILGEMRDAMSNMTDEQKNEFFSKAFNVRDTAAVKALLDVSKKGWKSLTQEIIDSKNAAENMKNVQLDNLDGDVTKLKNSFQEAKLAIVEGLTPSLRNYVKSGIILVQRLTNAFKRKGLKGAIEEAGAIFNNFIKTFKESDSPVLQKLGGALEGVKTVAKEVWGLITDFPGKLQEWESSDSPGLQALASLFGSLADAVDVVQAAFNGGLGGAIDKLKEIDSPLSNLAAAGLDIFKQICEIVAGNSEIGGIIETIVAGFIALKGIEISGSIIGFISKLIALGSLKNLGQLANLFKGGFNLPGTPGSDGSNAGNTAANTAGKTGGVFAAAKSFITTGGGISMLTPLLVAAAGIAPAIFARQHDERKWQADYERRMGSAQENSEKDFIERAAQAVMGDKYHQSDMGAVVNLLMGLKDRNNEQKAKLQSTLGSDLWTRLTGYWDRPDTYSDAMANELVQNIADKFAEKPVEVELEANKDAVDAAVAAMDYSTTVTLTPSMIWKNFFGQAKGNWTVPYDNYPSLLHRGEMVLNKSQARQFRDGEGGGFDVGSAINNAVASAMSKVYVMMNGDKVGDLTTKRVRKNINANSYNKLRAMGG